MIRFLFRWMFRLTFMSALFGAGLAIAGVALITHSKTVQGIIGLVIVFNVVKWVANALRNDNPRTYCTPELLNGDPAGGLPVEPGPGPRWTEPLQEADELAAAPPIQSLQVGGWDEPPAGYRGAAAALNTQPSDQTIDVWFQGTLHVQVTKDDVQPQGGFDELQPDDPVYKTVAAMAHYAQEILAGFTPGPYTDQDALAYAAAFLIPHELLERPILNPVVSAEGLGIPVELFCPDIIEPLRKAITDTEARTDSNVR